MRILILGAGPTGLGAAWRLQEHGHSDWLLLDDADRPGGQSMSVRDDAGFTWDLDGHVRSSHWQYFDRLLERALGDQWVEHRRDPWVWMRDRWIPYPVQNHVWRLPTDDLLRSLTGLVDVHCGQAQQRPRDFAAWLQRAFGDGLCQTFMYPYNEKAWACSPADLGVGWMGNSVAPVDLTRILSNLVETPDEATLVPGETFRYPLRGGTGSIWSALAARLPVGHLRFGRRIIQVDTGARRVVCADGTAYGYDRLISTIPLDGLLRSITDCPELSSLAASFVHSSKHVVGLGFAGQPSENLADKSLMYFPEPALPFHRATVFSNYAPHNVANPGQQWSMMAEVSESPARPVNAETIVDEVIAGFTKVGFIDPGTRIVTRFHRRLEYGAATPWLQRDEVLERVQPLLAEKGILSRGRFGAWKCEVSNQDHSCLQGVEAVDHLLTQRAESTVSVQVGVEPPAIVPPIQRAAVRRIVEAPARGGWQQPTLIPMRPD